MDRNVISNIYFKRSEFDDINDFAYNTEQTKVQVIFGDLLVLEFKDGTKELITLQNQKIEYSLNISYVSKGDLIKCNSKYDRLNDTDLGDIKNLKIVNSKYLHLINNNEFIIEGYDPKVNTDHNLVAIKYELSNGHHIFIYSSEPEEIKPNELFVGRPDSTICMIYVDNKYPRLEPIVEAEFPIKYKIKKNDT